LYFIISANNFSGKNQCQAKCFEEGFSIDAFLRNFLLSFLQFFVHAWSNYQRAHNVMWQITIVSKYFALKLIPVTKDKPNIFSTILPYQGDLT